MRAYHLKGLLLQFQQ